MGTGVFAMIDLLNCRWKSTLLFGEKVEINIGSNVEMEDRANKVKQFI